VLDAIDEATAIVAVPNVHWTDGSLVDLGAVGARAREVGAALVVDATQSLGALPLSIDSVQPDFLACASYKWLLGPYSTGFLYAHPRWHHAAPLEHNWQNRANSEDFAGLVDYKDAFQPGARRFDVGERSNFALMPMVVAALEQLEAWGVDAIAASLQSKTDIIADEARARGLHVAERTERGPHMLGVRFPGGAPSGILASLADENVHVSLRGDSIRISPHLYNRDEDIERLFGVLSAV
jgi:selenocysteine lyase/cysteine desulfurase